MSRFSIKNKTILITGASSGLGQHFATMLASEGARVILAARRTDKLAATVASISQAGGQAQSLTLDVADPAQVEQAFAKLEPLDVLINNAGINITGKTHQLSEEEWRQVLNTDLDGVWRCSKAAIKQWLNQNRPGIIVNIASILGLRVANQLGPYSAAKAAVVQLTKSIALDYARHNIRCNAICPGYFETDINRDFMRSEAGQKQIKRVPFRRMGEYSELDGPLLLLCSEASSYMSGAVVAVDGGHLCSSL